MDDLDRKLMFLISEDPRMQLRDLSKRLGVSRQAVNNRMQVFARAGVFKRMKATISAHYLDAIPAAVWGKSETTSVEQTIDSLGKNEFIGRVIVAGGNNIYVLGCLRKMSDLDGYVGFVRRTAEIPEPTVGMASFNVGILPDWMDGGRRRQTYRRLSALDLQIIASLQDDARKPTSEIAADVGASTKTVRRRLRIMRSEGSLDFDEPWDQPCGEDMLTVIHVDLRSNADKVEVARRLLSRDPIHLSYLRSFSNLPSFLLGLICSDKMSEVRTILRNIREDKDVLAVTPNLIYAERAYMNWMARCQNHQTSCETAHDKTLSRADAAPF